MVTTIRQRETAQDALERLAGKARSEGVKLFQSASTGGYVATSGTTQGKRYAVTAYSCECQGFERHHRCKHYAALMAALGWIDRPEDTPVASPAEADCRSCEGRGFHIKARRTGRGRFERVEELCPACHGAGTTLKAVA